MKALDILYSMIDSTRENVLSNKNTYERLTYIAVSIDELEQLNNRSCDNCIYDIDISLLSDEDSISVKQRCMSCSLFYENRHEPKDKE